MKKNRIFALILMIIFMTPAASFAGGKTLLCGADTVTQCAYDLGCMRTSAREVNLPRFFKVDLKREKISGVNMAADRNTAIKHLEETDDRYILQGAENGRAWSMVIKKGVGEMAATVSDNLVGFVVFGMCTED